MSRIRKAIRKDAYLGVRLPEADKQRLERLVQHPSSGSSSPSDFVYQLIRREVARLEKEIGQREEVGDSQHHFA
jgi:hypothetical protein